jgi:hypothetical protein
MSDLKLVDISAEIRGETEKAWRLFDGSSRDRRLRHGLDLRISCASAMGGIPGATASGGVPGVASAAAANQSMEVNMTKDDLTAARELLLVGLDPTAPAGALRATFLRILEERRAIVEADGKSFVDAEQLREVFAALIAIVQEMALPSTIMDSLVEEIAAEVGRLTGPETPHH